MKALHSVMGVAIKTLAGLFLASALNTGMAAGKLPYSHFAAGDPAKTPVIAWSDWATTPSCVLMGDWPDVDQAFQWLNQHRCSTRF